MFTPNYQLDIIDSNIASLTFNTFRDQSISLFRMSEFYESPYDQIRNQQFSIEDFLYTYMSEKGKINYFSYWDAYNIPGETVDSFIKTFEFQLTIAEKELLKIIFSYINSNEPYYLISALNGKKSDFEHELCHAKYKLDPVYKKKVRSIVEKIPKRLFKQFKNNLIEFGYANDDEIIVDEINAYLSTSSKKYIKNNFVFDDKILKYREMLSKEFKKIKKSININTIF